MMRMLAPSNFASVKEFEDALSQLKTVMGRIPTPHTGVREKDVPEVKAAYIPAARDGCAGIKATIGVRTAVGNEFSVNNLHFIQTDGGWMLAGADAEQPLELEAPKAP